MADDRSPSTEDEQVVSYDFLGSRWVTNRRIYRFWRRVGWVIFLIFVLAVFLV